MSWQVAVTPAQFGALQLGEVRPVALNRTRGGPLEADDQAPERRLPAARLPHDSKGLALAQVQVDAPHRLDGADLALHDGPGGDRVLLAETPQFQDHGAS